jgi:hypothetical protein
MLAFVGTFAGAFVSANKDGTCKWMHCYVFTELSYLIALPDSLSLGLSFFHLISHPIHCARLVSPCDLLIGSCDLLSCSTMFYHYYSYY